MLKNKGIILRSTKKDANDSGAPASNKKLKRRSSYFTSYVFDLWAYSPLSPVLLTDQYVKHQNTINYPLLHLLFSNNDG